MPSSTIDASKFDTISDTIAAFRNGEFIVVLDDADRENEADLIIAGHKITTEQMAFMVRHSSGLICAPITPSLTKSLALPQMVHEDVSEDAKGTAYTISIDGADPSITTGISAHDRALTVRTLADPTARVDSFRRPGHVFPLRARAGGVRVRRGHTEAAVEFCRLAGLSEVAAICELVEDGDEVPGRAERSEPGMMRGESCVRFARRWGLKVCTIEDLVKHVEKTEGHGTTTNGTA